MPSTRTMGLVVVRQNLFGEVMEEQVEIHDVALLPQILQTNIMIFLKQVDVAELGPPALSRHVGQAVASSGTHPDDVREADAAVHKAVQHAAGEHAPHATSLEHEG